MYSATATMMVNPGLSGTATDFNSLNASARLAETYQQLVTTQPIYDRVAEALGEEELTSTVTTSAVEGSQLIRVTVTDTDPAHAALVANTVVSEFTEHISEQANARAENTRSGIDTQLEALQERQQEIDQQIADLEAGQNADDDSVQRQIEGLQQQRATINDALIELESSAITFDTQTMASSAQIQMVEPALEPKAPFSPQPMRSLLLGLFVGALLGAGLVALLEFLDNTVKPEVNVQAIANAPVLATISALSKIEPGGRQVYTMSQPQSGASEAVRLLRTNLEFASASNPIHSITVSSASPGEGKSTTAANLGVVMAQSGLTCAVIDADLRKPTMHRIFGVENTAGLTTLLTHPDQSWEQVAKKVALPGLFLIPSGPIPPNPSDLLSSVRFERLIDQIKDDVDLVIVDSPPTLSASDALSISRHTDGVILVCHSNKTRIDSLRHAAESIHQGGIRLIGVVLNRQKGQQAGSYYGEYYGSATTETPAPAGDWGGD
jgi:non-specific protein-tyrosine kinase